MSVPETATRCGLLLFYLVSGVWFGFATFVHSPWGHMLAPAPPTTPGAAAILPNPILILCLAAALFGSAIGACAIAIARDTPGNAEKTPLASRENVLVSLCWVLPTAGMVDGQIGCDRALALAVFASVTVVSLFSAMVSLDSEPVEMQSQWGGLGGGLGGWQLSRPAVLLLIGLVFAMATALAATPPGTASVADVDARKATTPDSLPTASFHAAATVTSKAVNVNNLAPGK